MAWLWINGSFIDAPAVAARRTDLVLHSTWQQPSCQYFQQHWIKMGDFQPQSQLSSIAALKLHFQCFFHQFICLTFHLSTVDLPYLVLLECPFSASPSSSSILPPRFFLLGDFPVGVTPSAQQYSHVNQRVTVCLMLMAATCLFRHLLESLCISMTAES